MTSNGAELVCLSLPFCVRSSLELIQRQDNRINYTWSGGKEIVYNQWKMFDRNTFKFTPDVNNGILCQGCQEKQGTVCIF